MNINFKFHGIGQGLFYSGKISDFNFIYDCGSDKKNLLKSKIDDYIANNFNSYKKLDLLIVSHFDNDHINGLNHLLKKVNVDTIVIPYFNPFERLLLSLVKPNLDDFYYDFLVDPVDFLLERKVNKIVLLSSKSGLEPNFNESYNGDSERKKETKFNIEDLENDEELYKFFLENEIDWKKDNRLKNVYIKNHNKSLIILNCWIFRFFNYKVSNISMNLFKNELLKHRINFDGSRQSLRKIIKDKNTRDKFKNSYKKLHSNLNDTSIILYHGPINYKNIQYNYHIECCNYVDFKGLCQLCNIKYPQLGQFLTGDINLNTNYSDIYLHFYKYLQEIILALVPHHCAQSNWNPKFLSDLPNCYNYIASTGLINKHNLPRYRVISSIKNYGKYFSWNNEKNEIVINGQVNW